MEEPCIIYYMALLEIHHLLVMTPPIVYNSVFNLFIVIVPIYPPMRNIAMVMSIGYIIVCIL
jgi:hypothetical protein